MCIGFFLIFFFILLLHSFPTSFGNWGEGMLSSREEPGSPPYLKCRLQRFHSEICLEQWVLLQSLCLLAAFSALFCLLKIDRGETP